MRWHPPAVAPDAGRRLALLFPNLRFYFRNAASVFGNLFSEGFFPCGVCSFAELLFQIVKCRFMEANQFLPFPNPWRIMGKRSNGKLGRDGS